MPEGQPLCSQTTHKNLPPPPLQTVTANRPPSQGGDAEVAVGSPELCYFAVCFSARQPEAPDQALLPCVLEETWASNHSGALTSEPRAL